MKKILLFLGLCSSLAFSEVYYKNKDNKYNDREADYLNNDNRRSSSNDQIYVNGYVTNVNEWRDYMIIQIKLRDGNYIKAKVGKNEGFYENDLVNGTCVNYKYGQYERCSLYRR
jgi:hypothetical protein